MRVFMRIPEKKEYHFAGRRTVRWVLQQLGLNPEAVIVIHGDTLLTPDDEVGEEDEIEIRPAISGGGEGRAVHRMP